MCCVLCKREKELTKHHLIPKTLHKRYRKKFGKLRLKETVDVCDDCHSQIHKLFTEKELALEYNTLELLLESAGCHHIVSYNNIRIEVIEK